MQAEQVPAAKEVVSYRTALWQGYELVKAHEMLTANMKGFLTSEKIGKERIYQNKRLYDLVKYGQ